MQSGDYSDFLGTAAATNDWPDIYILTPWTQVQDFAEAGRLQDLSGMDFTEKVYPTALEAATYDGKIYGYPANVEYLGVFYNKQMFKDAGIEEVPKTRDEFEAACEKLEESGVTPIASTFKDSWTLKHMFSVMMSNVGQILCAVLVKAFSILSSVLCCRKSFSGPETLSAISKTLYGDVSTVETSCCWRRS